MPTPSSSASKGCERAPPSRRPSRPRRPARCAATCSPGSPRSRRLPPGPRGPRCSATGAAFNVICPEAGGGAGPAAPKRMVRKAAGVRRQRGDAGQRTMDARTRSGVGTRAAVDRRVQFRAEHRGQPARDVAGRDVRPPDHRAGARVGCRTRDECGAGVPPRPRLERRPPRIPRAARPVPLRGGEPRHPHDARAVRRLLAPRSRARAAARPRARRAQLPVGAVARNEGCRRPRLRGSTRGRTCRVSSRRTGRTIGCWRGTSTTRSATHFCPP